MKQIYRQPVAEVLEERLAAALMDASIESNLESYGEQNDFTW